MYFKKSLLPLCEISSLIIFLCWSFCSKFSDATDLPSLFAKHHIVPDILEKAPKEFYKVKFRRNCTTYSPDNGAEIQHADIPQYVHAIECPGECRQMVGKSRLLMIVLSPHTPDPQHPKNKNYLIALCIRRFNMGEHHPKWIYFHNEEGEQIDCELVDYEGENGRTGKHPWVFLFTFHPFEDVRGIKTTFTKEERENFDLLKYGLATFGSTAKTAYLYKAGNIFFVNQN